VAWLAPPELPVGAEPELKPPELELELPVLDPEFVELDPEFVELEPEFVELEPEPELVPVEPELVPVELEPELELAEVAPDPLDVLVVWVDPGRARARAPAVTTLAMVTAVVVDRTLDRPRSLAATAWRIPSFRRSLLISLILPSRTRESLHEPSGPAMNCAAFPLAGRGYPANMKDT
jgi:hypothetical protein